MLNSRYRSTCNYEINLKESIKVAEDDDDCEEDAEGFNILIINIWSAVSFFLPQQLCGL